MFNGGGWWRYLDAETVRPKVTRHLIMRVLEYARPYRLHILWLLGTILITTVLGLLTPLIFRDLIDNTLPNQDAGRLNLLAIALVAIPVFVGGIRIVQRRLNSWIGEGVIYDLRVALYAHMQKMSLRFFTNTKTG
ncbi:MAG TPA: ABC transporter transmembrane domain-containing protein, partial [Aggregatilineales bacterium]|nr:ABC transporter transmembrane domain-containing protein [Aggregatilineales bacterium]